MDQVEAAMAAGADRAARLAANCGAGRRCAWPLRGAMSPVNGPLRRMWARALVAAAMRRPSARAAPMSRMSV